MSSRVLRKLNLQGDQDLPSIGDNASDPEADFSSSGGHKKKQLTINKYDLLNQQSPSESEVKEDDDHETAGSLNAQEGAIDLRDNSRRKKKKKKKKHKMCKMMSNARSSEDNIEDEVERSVRDVNKIFGEVPEVPHSSVRVDLSLPPKKSVLSIELKALNPNYELRRIFGAKVLQNEQNKKRGRNRGHLKTTYLVTPRDTWPPAGKSGISMKPVGSKNSEGIQFFAFEHSLSYQQVQVSFLDAVESHDPDNLVGVINNHPYHVDSLLQLSELCQLTEDLSLAGQFIERALYCLECAFHPTFNLASGNCRLDYRKQENRALFVALFKHMCFVGARACYRTALEFCKLILSLDPEGDPLAVVLALDFYALRSQEYEWLVRISEEWENSRHLLQLPNFAYSVAVALFQMGNVEAAHQQLQSALIMFPGVLLALTEKCGTQIDSRVSSSPFFNSAQSKQSKPLTHLESLYVARSYHVWKESELLPWLESNVHAVLDRVDAKDPLVAEWERNRTSRYPSTPKNIRRHIILSNLEGISISFSEQEMEGSVFNFDPLPPSDSINLYSRAVRPRQYVNDNTLSMFFRSIMPTFIYNQMVSDEANEEGGGGGEGGSGVDFQRSVATLLDTMRDLLSSIHLPDVPGDGDNEDDPDSDEGRI